MGMDGAAGQRGGGDEGQNTDASGSAGGMLPGSRLQPSRLQESAMPARPQGGAKWDRDFDTGPVGGTRGKRQAAEPTHAQAESLLAVAERERDRAMAGAAEKEAAQRAAMEREHEEIAAKMLLLQRAAEEEEANRQRMRQELKEREEREDREDRQRQMQMDEATNSDSDASEGGRLPTLTGKCWDGTLPYGQYVTCMRAVWHAGYAASARAALQLPAAVCCGRRSA